MLRALTGSLIAAAVVLVLPAPPASAAGPSPSFSVPSFSYSAQPRPFSVRIDNRLDGGNLVATMSNSGSGTVQMTCAPDGAINGKGPWLCTAQSRPLSPGTVRVTAQGVDPSNSSRNSARVTRSGSVSSRFSVSGPGSVPESSAFTVTGARDHVSGVDDYRVTARMTRDGASVAGQSAVACSASGGGYSCALHSVAGDGGSSYVVTVTEHSAASGDSRSGATTVAVASGPVPAAPRVTGPGTIVADQQPFTVTGTASASGLRIEVLVDSQDWATPAATCTSTSSLTWSCAVPGRYAAGSHTLSVRAYDPANPSRISAVSVHTAVVEKPGAKPSTKPTPTATATPTPSPTPTPSQEPVQAVDPVHHVKQIGPVGGFTGLSGGADNLVVLLLLGLGLVAIARPRSLARAGSTSVAFTDADALDPFTVAHRHDSVGPGDQSNSWRLFGPEILDEFSRLLPVQLARRSPFLARLALDGTEVRAVLGGLWWLLPLGGVVLGLTAAGQAGGEAVPPSLGVLLGVVVLAAFDATAGFLASLVFGVALVATASDRTHGLLVALGVGVLWTALPLVASSLRPFRRPRPRPGRWIRYGWDRVADVLLAALVCGWLAKLLAEVMSQLAGRATDIPADANAVGVVAGAAIGLRVLFSHAAELWWPERLVQTEAYDDLPEPSTLSVVTGIVLRGLAFAFVGHVFIGSCWQWVLGSLLFVLPEVAAFADSRYGGRWHHGLPVPRGLSGILVVVVAGAALVTLAVSMADSESEALRWVFLFGGALSAVAGLARTFDAAPRQPGSSWRMQVGGVAVAAVVAVLAVHGLNF